MLINNKRGYEIQWNESVRQEKLSCPATEPNLATPPATSYVDPLGTGSLKYQPEVRMLAYGRNFLSGYWSTGANIQRT